MNGTMSFFRVFDLAFFAPGAVLFWALNDNGMLPLTDQSFISADIGTVQGIVGAISIIGLVYLLGLIVHGVREWIFNGLATIRRRCVKCDSQQSTESWKSWYLALSRTNIEQISLYFWYMRATCWNLMFSGIAASAIKCVLMVYALTVDVISVTYIAVFVMGSVVTYSLGRNFDSALHNASKCLSADPGASHPQDQ